MPQPQLGGAKKPETNTSVPQQEGHAGTTGGKHVTDNDLDVEYEPESNDEPDAKEDEEEENSNVEYVKMEIPCQEALGQWTMHHEVQGWIWHVHAA